MPKAETHDASNVTPELITEALAVYTEDKGEHQRTAMKLARNQAKYERMGVSAKHVRQMYQEADLTSDERQHLYATELRYRRATSLWDAETDSDFDRLMEAASQTEAAPAQAAERLAGARAYNDGFNSAVQGKQTVADNPREPGTIEHAQWAKGCKDGHDHLAILDGAAKPSQAPKAEQPAPDAPPKRRGRPPKAAKTDVIPDDEHNGAGLLTGFDLPTLPN